MKIEFTLYEAIFSSPESVNKSVDKAEDRWKIPWKNFS